METENLTNENAWKISEAFIQTIPAYPGHFYGRGIVICAGGVRYFTNAWVCIHMLRRLGCYLPIQVWYLGSGEMDEKMKSIVRPFNIHCVDGAKVRRVRQARILNGWELKPYAILNCPFQEVLLLDADNVPVVNPEFLFETPEYLATGAIFWPDFGRLEASRGIWEICGVDYRDEPEFESGQIVVDKERCWEALSLALWYNEHSDFYYRHIHGDKETFHLAFRKLRMPYAMPQKGIHALEDTMCQHDFRGNRVFQHRNLDKWRLAADNKPIAGFLFEDECRAYLAQLRKLWNGRIYPDRFQLDTLSKIAAAKKLAGKLFDYHRVGHDRRPLGLLEDGTIGTGAADQERFWDFAEENGNPILQLWSFQGVTCRMTEAEDGVWRGHWIIYEKMPIELTLLNGVPQQTHPNGPLTIALGGNHNQTSVQ